MDHKTNSKETWCFVNSFKIPSIAMYVNRSHPFITKNCFWYFQFFGLSLVNSITLFCLCNSIIFHDIKNENYAEASKNGSMLIICLNSNIKYYTMLFHRDSIARLMNTIDSDYNEAMELDSREKEVVVSYSKKGVMVCKFWIVVATITCFVFPGKAFYLMAYSYSKGRGRLVPMFDLTYPFFLNNLKTTPLGFCALFSLCLMFDSYATIVYIGFEPLIPIFTLHTCGQLDLLSLRMSKLLTESKHENDIHETLKSINVKLQELYRFIGHVQNNFMILMEFNMKTTAILIPFTSFQFLEELRVNNIINIEFFILFIATIIHFLTPCLFSDILIDSSEKFRQAIYSCGWESCRHIRVRKTVLFMIIRTSRPLGISTVFYPVSLDTFATMCRQAYAILNLMNAAFT